MSEIIPTVVPKSIEAVDAIARQFSETAQTIHIDVTDGDFAFPTTWTPSAGTALPGFSGIYEAHLMVRDAKLYGERFARAGAWRVIAQLESFATNDDAQNALGLFKVSGAHETGIALMIDTSIDRLDTLSARIDVVHLMSIRKIGAQGEHLDPRIYERVREVRRRFPQVAISVDGGVNEENIAELVHAGATRLCVGSALAHAEDPIAAFRTLTTLSQSSAVQ